MLLSLLFSVLTFAASDSVAVFLRPEKAVVLVNEYRAASRLNGMMDAFGAGDKLFWQTGEFYVNCGREPAGITCTFRVLPAGGGSIETRRADWQGEGPAEDFSIRFESSRGNTMEFSSTGGHLSFQTWK